MGRISKQGFVRQAGPIKSGLHFCNIVKFTTL